MPKLTVVLLLFTSMVSAASLAYSFRIAQSLDPADPAVVSERSVIVDAAKHSLGQPNSDPKNAKGGNYIEVTLGEGDILELTVGRQIYTAGIGNKDVTASADGVFHGNTVDLFNGYLGCLGCLFIAIGQEILHLPTGVTRLIIGESTRGNGVRFFIWDGDFNNNGGSVLVNVRHLRPVR